MNLEVEEVSVVDRAANKRKFLIVKRDTGIQKQEGGAFVDGIRDGVEALVAILSSIQTMEEEDFEITEDMKNQLSEVGQALTTLSGVTLDEADKSKDDVDKSLETIDNNKNNKLAEWIDTIGKKLFGKENDMKNVIKVAGKELTEEEVQAIINKNIELEKEKEALNKNSETEAEALKKKAEEEAEALKKKTEEEAEALKKKEKEGSATDSEEEVAKKIDEAVQSAVAEALKKSEEAVSKALQDNGTAVAEQVQKCIEPLAKSFGEILNTQLTSVKEGIGEIEKRIIKVEGFTIAKGQTVDGQEEEDVNKKKGGGDGSKITDENSPFSSMLTAIGGKKSD